MKKGIIYILVLLLVVTACTKRTDLIFSGTVDARVQAALKQDSAILMSSTHGWKAILYPGNGEGAYFFYIQFRPDGSVITMGDIDETTATKPDTSTFRLKAIQLPALIFDTYGYIHKLSDPDPDVSGGTAGKGQYADFEFSFLSVQSDSIVLKGNVNGSSLVLARASEAEAGAYKAGALRELMNTTGAYGTSNPYLFLLFPDGTKMPFGLSVRNKMAVLQYVDEHNTIVNLSTNFYFTQDSLHLRDALSYKGYVFQDVFWDKVAKLFYVKLNGQATNVGVAPTVFKLLLQPALHTEVFKTYASILINPADSAGLPKSFRTILSGCINTLKTSGRLVTKIELLFPASGQAQLKFSYTSGTTSTYSSCTYEMTIDANGVAGFVMKAAITNSVVKAAVAPFTDYLSNNKFTFSYVANTSTSALLGGLFNTTDVNSYFFGELKN